MIGVSIATVNFLGGMETGSEPYLPIVNIAKQLKSVTVISGVSQSPLPLLFASPNSILKGNGVIREASLIADYCHK